MVIVGGIVIKVSLFIAGGLVLLLLSTLLLNHAPLLQQPGPFKRLSIYLTRNSALTADNHDFPELRTPVFSAAPGDVYRALQDAVLELGWNVVSSNDAALQMELMVETPMLRFRDDVYVSIGPADNGEDTALSSMNVRSHSRVGRGDFGANAGHVIALVERVKFYIDKHAAEESAGAGVEGSGRDLSRR